MSSLYFRGIFQTPLTEEQCDDLVKDLQSLRVYCSEDIFGLKRYRIDDDFGYPDDELKGDFMVGEIGAYYETDDWISVCNGVEAIFKFFNIKTTVEPAL